MFKNLSKTIACATLGLALGLSSFQANAQFNTQYFKKEKNPYKEKSDWTKRLELGGHYVIGKADYNQTINSVHHNGTELVSHILNFGGEIDAVGFGGQLGTYIPLTSVVRKSIIAFTIHGQVSFVNYELGRIQVAPGAVSNTETTLKQTRIAVPLGFEFKWGGQATLNKADWASIGFGGGVAPTYEMFDKILVAGEAKEKFTIRPYLRVEAGFRTAVFWKVHATWMFSSIYNYRKSFEDKPVLSLENPSYDEGYMRTMPIINLGLTFNIGSFGWDKFW